MAASSSPSLFTAILFLLSTAFTIFHVSNASSIVLPIVKDNIKGQYFASFVVGTPPTTRVSLVIDLSNKWSWFTCEIYGYKSSTYRPLSCDSPTCDDFGKSFCTNCDGPLSPSCNKNTCGAFTYSPWSDSLYGGSLIQDVMSLYKMSPNNLAPLLKTSLPTFSFTCGEKGPLKGLSPHTKGILTLSRTLTALHAQISSFFKVPHKFALCLPGSSISGNNNGAIYFGGSPYHFSTSSRPIDLSTSLVTTPLVINPNSTAPISTEGESSVEYFINVNAIKVDGTPIRFKTSLLSFDKNGVGGTKISTMEPYTVLHNDIYMALINVFVSKAMAMKITKVAPVAPFTTCFNAKTMTNSKTGPVLPIIDIILNGKSPVLKNKNARWRIYGANSMVKVSDNVLCLGFVDGGSSPMTSIVIGGKQMEDTLVEVDLEASKLGITSSLLRMGTSCSQFRGI